VGGRTVKIIYPYIFNDSDEYCGQADYQKGEIRISKYSRNGVERSDEDTTLTFLHEIIHWICNVYNGEKQFEEPQINGLTQGLYQVLKDSGLKF
jgi:hypothetical protein